MSQASKYMFDECLGEPMMNKLKELVPGPVLFDHVCKKFCSGIADNEWIPRLAEETGWIVISGDRAKKGGSKKGGKLPLLCKAHKITHILLSASLQSKNSREKIAALALVWGQIAELHKEPPGSRFILRYREKERAGMRIVLQAAKQN